MSSRDCRACFASGLRGESRTWMRGWRGEGGETRHSNGKQKGLDKTTIEESERLTCSWAGRRPRGRTFSSGQQSHSLQGQQGLTCFLCEKEKRSSTKPLLQLQDEHSKYCAEVSPSTSVWLKTSSVCPWRDSCWWPHLQAQTPSKGGRVPPQRTSSAWGNTRRVKCWVRAEKVLPSQWCVTVSQITWCLCGAGS